MKRLLLLFFLLAGIAQATTAPRVYYTDLKSGPKTGGESNNGTILTISGKYFGASQGGSTVTVGGGAVATYKSWADGKIQVAIGASAATGTVVVTVGGQASVCVNTWEGCTFTVRSGNLYYLNTAGSDSAAGTFAAPWKTILKARSMMVAGDITYVENGVNQTANDGSGENTSLWLDSSGTNGNPIAYVTYPGATSIIGSNSITYGIRWSSGARTDLVIAGFTLKGIAGISLEGGSRVRVINNYITCPNGDGQLGCMNAGSTSFIEFYGNEVTGDGSIGGQPSKQYHDVYFTTDDNHIDAGWNNIHDNLSCRAIQFHSSPVGGTSGQNQFDLHVHDNVIHDNPCDGINFATVDPSKGTVEAYNNLIYNVGIGPDPPDGSANYAGIYSADTTNAGAAGSGAIKIYNNTFYHCGSHTVFSGDNGYINKNGNNSALTMQLRNNIFQAVGGSEVYLATANGGGLSHINGDHNEWYGKGAGPSQTTSNVNSDPLFVSTVTPDFHWQVSSPANGAGTTTTVSVYDLDALLRPNPPSIGAYEIAGVPQATTPSCSPIGGTYLVTQSVTCSTPAGPVICYTTDGSTPATNGTSGCTTGTLYSGAITVSATETLKAIAGGTGYTDSLVATYSYTISGAPGAPTSLSLFVL